MTPREFAIQAHGDQMYGNHPYVYHLDAVAKICEPYGDEAVKVAYLHDVIEDTGVSALTLANEFGLDVFFLVGLCSDEPGQNRKDRKRKTNAKLKEVIDDFRLALIVKAADRLANLREGNKNDMYGREHSDFKAAAYRPGLCDELWSEMDAILDK